MLRLQINDAAIMTGRGNVRRWLIGDGGKAAHFGLLGIRPVRPKAGDIHGLRRLGFELQDDILFLFAGVKPSMLHGVPLDVFVKALHDHDGVVVAELLAPELFEIVAPGVVEAGELLVIERGLAGGAAEVAHRCEEVLAVLFDDDAGVDKRKYAVVVRFSARAARGAM